MKKFDPDEDVAWLVLHRVTWRNANVMPDSRVVITNCGHRGWMAPSSEKYLAEDEVGRGAYVICSSCAAQQLPYEEDVQYAAVPGAQSEFAKAMGEANSEEIFSWLRSQGVEEWKHR